MGLGLDASEIGCRPVWGWFVVYRLTANRVVFDGSGFGNRQRPWCAVARLERSRLGWPADANVSKRCAARRFYETRARG